MLYILIPARLKKELNYIVNYIFKLRLNVAYKTEFHEENFVRVYSDSHERSIYFSCDGLKKINDNWMKEESLPNDNLENFKFLGIYLPIIYGKANVDNCSNYLSINFDVFASIFFMLSRYEEVVKSCSMDSQGRFSAKDSLAYKNSFLERPIVDEYIELVWKILKLEYSFLNRTINKKDFLITCDVDWPFDPAIYNAKVAMRSCVGDIVKGRGLQNVKYKVLNYFKQKVGLPYSDKYRDSLTWIMDENEKNGNRVAFYFIPVKTSYQDPGFSLNSKKMHELLKEINARGHEIGIHPGYECFDNPLLFEKSCKELENVLCYLGINSSNLGGRMHFLRWNAVITPTLWDSAGYRYDSTLSYADMSGFRCGTCHPFPMYDLQERKELSVLQRPLISMETTILSPIYENVSYENDEALKRFMTFKKIVNKFNGEYVLLWHNSYLVDKRDRLIYQELIKK